MADGPSKQGWSGHLKFFFPSDGKNDSPKNKIFSQIFLDFDQKRLILAPKEEKKNSPKLEQLSRSCP